MHSKNVSNKVNLQGIASLYNYFENNSNKERTSNQTCSNRPQNRLFVCLAEYELAMCHLIRNFNLRRFSNFNNKNTITVFNIII